MNGLSNSAQTALNRRAVLRLLAGSAIALPVAAAGLKSELISRDALTVFGLMDASAAPAEMYLSDMQWKSATNGWGPVERDLSNGEKGAADGRTLSINGVSFPKGLGVHAPSRVEYALDGTYQRFQASIGIDDEVVRGSNQPNVIFKVLLDGATVYASPELTGGAALPISVELGNARTLALVVEPNGKNWWDHADWAMARLTTPVSEPPEPEPPEEPQPPEEPEEPAPPPPSGDVFLSDVQWTSVTNGWGPVERDRSNGEKGANDGRGISLGGVGYTKGLGAHAPSRIEYALGGGHAWFHSLIGLDDEVGRNAASVIFKVLLDGATAFTSPAMGPGAVLPVSVALGNARTLALVVEPNGNNWWDHADWAMARLSASGDGDAAPSPPQSPPAAPPAPEPEPEQGGPFTSIQAAVNAAPANSTVTVPAGVYRETVVIDKPLILVGQPGAVIDGEMKREKWVDIESDSVTIRGFEMRYANSPDQRGGLSNDGHSNVTFENLNLHHANGAALSIGSAHGHIHTARNVRVINCDLHDNGQLGLHGWATVDSLIENCRIYGNNTRGVATNWEAGAFKVTETVRMTVRNCEVYANHGPGIWFDIDCVDCVTEGCRVHGNNSIGVHYEISRGGVFRNNLIWANGFGSSGWGSGSGIRIANSRDCRIEGNVVAWNADGITITGQDRTYQNKTFYVITGNQITNNTIALANPNGEHNVFGLAFVWDRDFLTTSWSHSGNRMWHEHPNTPNSCGGPEGWGPNTEAWFTQFDPGGDWLTRSEMQSRLSAAGLPTSP